MKKALAFVVCLVVVCIVLVMINGCTRAYVSEQYSNHDQIVIKHATHKTWVRKAHEQADTHCNQYHQIAILTTQNCGNKNYLTGVSECYSTFECKDRKQDLESAQIKYLKMIQALEQAQLQVQIERKEMAECMEMYGVRKCQELRKGK
jgi:uncharacterized membrane protein